MKCEVLVRHIKLWKRRGSLNQRFSHIANLIPSY